MSGLAITSHRSKDLEVAGISDYTYGGFSPNFCDRDRVVRIDFDTLCKRKECVNQIMGIGSFNLLQNLHKQAQEARCDLLTFAVLVAAPLFP
jgi:hypothetical protein